MSAITVSKDTIRATLESGVTARVLLTKAYKDFHGVMVNNILYINVTNLTKLRKAKIVRGVLYKYKHWYFRGSGRGLKLTKDGSFDTWKAKSFAAMLKTIKEG